LDAQNKLQDAEKLARQALALRTNPSGGEHTEVAESLTALGIVLEHRGSYPEAEDYHRQALALHRKLFGEQHQRVAISLNCLAQAIKEQGRFAEAEELYRQALEIQKQYPTDVDTTTSVHNLAVFLEQRGRLDAADVAHREAQQAWRILLGDKHPNVAISVNSLGMVYQKQGRFAQAVAEHRKALQLQIELLGSNHLDVVISLNNLAEDLRQLGQPAEAEPLFRRAVEILQTLQGDYPGVMAAVKNNLGRVLREQERLSEAEALQREVLGFRRTQFGREHPSVATSLNDLALVLHDQGRHAEAERTYQEALGLQIEPTARAAILENLARALVAAGRPGDAQPLVEQCIVIRDERLTNHWRGFSARALLAQRCWRKTSMNLKKARILIEFATFLGNSHIFSSVLGQNRPKYASCQAWPHGHRGPAWRKFKAFSRFWPPFHAAGDPPRGKYGTFWVSQMPRPLGWRAGIPPGEDSLLEA
jgi:tetratricopeptide (TPR) repeat protein